MPDGAGLVAALRAVLPAGIALAHDDPQAGPFGLMPGEALVNAMPKRLAEFAAGRRAARAAMEALGVVPLPIPHGPDRAPQWPTGVVGSISHTDGLCIAIVGRAGDWDMLGLDIELDCSLDPALWPEILRPEELARIETLANCARASAAMAVFVAKEAIYKAQYPVSRTMMDFQAMAIEPQGDGFAAGFTRDVPGFAKGTVIAGRYCRAAGHVAAFCAIRRAPVA